ncbi:MAG: class F sortase [Propionibacteriaceae bacterium]|nr:class F sortase [Propionibacteriaceae bacterium]
MAEDNRGEQPEEERKRRKGFFIPLLITLSVLLMLGAIGMWGYSQIFPPQENAQRDIEGNWVVPEDPEEWTPEIIAEMDPEPEISGKRFRVPAVGLDAPLGAMNAVKNVINPPGFRSVFWIRNMGVSLDRADQGTVYMAAHSLRNGGVGPGNYLIDVENARGKVPIGAEMYADNVKYRVTEVISVPKTKLDEKVEVWDATVPGRIVVVTCLQRPNNGRSVNNIVVVGVLDALYGQ